LRAGDDYLVSRLDSVEDYIVVADDLTDLERLLVDYVSTFWIGLSDEREIEAADSRDGHDRNHRLFLAAPD
jgi:hypothetical protein